MQQKRKHYDDKKKRYHVERSLLSFHVACVSASMKRRKIAFTVFTGAAQLASTAWLCSQKMKPLLMPAMQAIVDETHPIHMFTLSLGRVVPAPHTRHLLGLFAAIAQNSLLRSLSIVDSFARKQHYCRGSE